MFSYLRTGEYLFLSAINNAFVWLGVILATLVFLFLMRALKGRG